MKKEIIRLTEQDLHNLIKESVNTILKESFNHWQSPKLAEIIKQHGMPKCGPTALSHHYFLTQLRDDNIDSVSNQRQGEYSIKLGDGTYFNFNTKNNPVAQKYCGQSCHNFTGEVVNTIRPNNQFAAARDYNVIPDDFYSRQHYQPSTRRGEDARDLRHNPYFKDGKNKQYNPESSWNRNTAQQAMNNLRAGKDQYGNDNKRI